MSFGHIVAAMLMASALAAAPVADVQHVDPELRQIARAVLQAQSKDQSKPARPANPSRVPDGVATRQVEAAPGHPPVTVYVINATPGATPRGAILFIHGGGYVAGDARDDLRRLVGLATRLNCTIVSVQYRLAPQTHFPGALEDNYAALKWLYRNADTLGVDRTRMVLMGESAGGGHAAMLAIAARDRGEVPLAGQVLVYPMLDDRTGATRSVAPSIGQVIWRAQDNRAGWTALLGQPAGSANVAKGAVPARVSDLRGLPPTFIGVGSIDLFAEEDIEFARRLVGAEVPTDLIVVPGAFHGFQLIAPRAAVSKQFTAALEAALARLLAEAKRR